MQNIERKQTVMEAAGHIVGLGVGAFSALCQGKHISAAIIVLAGAVLLLGSASLHHSEIQSAGSMLSTLGLAGWLFSSSQS